MQKYGILNIYNTQSHVTIFGLELKFIFIISFHTYTDCDSSQNEKNSTLNVFFFYFFRKNIARDNHFNGDTPFFTEWIDTNEWRQNSWNTYLTKKRRHTLYFVDRKEIGMKAFFQKNRSMYLYVLTLVLWTKCGCTDLLFSI